MPSILAYRLGCPRSGHCPIRRSADGRLAAVSTLGDLATSALTHDAAAALVAIEEHAATHPLSADDETIRTFVQVLACEFDLASSWQPEEEAGLPGAVGGFLSAVCLA